MAKLAPLHPGEVLREEFLVPLGLTAYALAEQCHIPRTRIVAEEVGISADTARRLSTALATTPEF
jgi:addiction module HigA family antidote